MRHLFRQVLCAAFFCLLVLALATLTVGQGKGRGGGVGGGRGSGAGNGGGPPAGIGVDRGLGNASGRSGGRSDAGLENASMNSKGRSDAGLERARLRRENMNNADHDLREHPGIPQTLHVNANSLRSGYQTALLTNPNLTFGHYVAATRLAQNLGRRFPNITRDAILGGLASGRSMGSTLKDLGLSDQESKAARKRAEDEIKQAKKMK
jgi:hypothetical protein